MNSMVIVPPQFREDLLVFLCTEVALGERSLKEICRQEDRVPPYALVQAWLKRDIEFQVDMEQAVKVMVMSGATEVIPIADNVDEDASAVSKARLQIDTRLKMLKMMKDSGIVTDEKGTGDEHNELRTVKKIIDAKRSGLPPGAAEVDGEIVDAEIVG